MQLRGRLEASAPQEVCRPHTPPQVAACDQHAILWFRSAAEKPKAYLTRAALGRALVRAAAGAPLEGVNQVASFPADLRTRKVVAVWTLGPAGGRNLFLGYVWLAACDNAHGALTAELQALELAHAA